MALRDLFSKKRKQARVIADALIRQGLPPLAEVPFQVSLNLEDELDDEVLEKIVAVAWEEARGRPDERAGSTSLERLATAFAQLETHGIMARHYPQAGRSEAYSSIWSELQAAAKQKHEFQGCGLTIEPCRRRIGRYGRW